MNTQKKVDRAFAVLPWLTVILLSLSLVNLLCGCTATRPLDAYMRPNGTKVGTSKNIVFLRGYDANEGLAVAQDHANITTVDSVTVKRRIRAFGGCYITTVTGK